MAANWSSLPSDLLKLVADVLLSTGDDLDYYAILRAVCRDWQAAIASRSSLDPRPGSWVMLESRVADAADDYRCSLFLDVDTGNFELKYLPMLHDYPCVARDKDGLLVLLGPSNTKKNYYALNPITGVRIRFPMKYPVYAPNGRMVVQGSWPKVALYGFNDHQHGASVVNLNCQLSTFSAKPDIDSFDSVVSYQGGVYAMDCRGTIAVLENQWRITTVIAGDFQAPWRPSFLVNNSGELLVVRLPARFHDIMQVFRVDLDNKLLRIINTIGNRAIFLGHRSLSVDAGKLHTIKSNCIYYNGGPRIYMHRLAEDHGGELVEPIDTRRQPPPRPLSLMRTLMNYANDGGRTDLDRHLLPKTLAF